MNLKVMTENEDYHGDTEGTESHGVSFGTLVVLPFSLNLRVSVVILFQIITFYA